jgi:AraC-like DNA-binding protein
MGMWDWNCRVLEDYRHDSIPYFLINEPGVYEFKISVREIGAKIDAVVFKKSNRVPQMWGLNASKSSEELKLTDFNALKEKKKKRNMIIIGIVIICLFSVLLLIVLRFLRDRKRDVQKENHLVVKARDFIRENYGRSIKLDDIAQSVNISKSYLRALFRRNMKTTVNKYLLEFRLKQAHQVLESKKDENVSNIAFSCGFENVSHFSKAFKEFFGYNPSQVKHKN